MERTGGVALDFALDADMIGNSDELEEKQGDFSMISLRNPWKSFNVSSMIVVSNTRQGTSFEGEALLIVLIERSLTCV